MPGRPGCRGESLAEALATIDDWHTEQRVGATSCRVGGRPYHLHDKHTAREEQRVLQTKWQEATRR